MLSTDAADTMSTLATLAVISWVLVALIIATAVVMTQRFGPDRSL